MPVQLVQVDASTLASQASWQLDLEKIYLEADFLRPRLAAAALDAPLFINQALQLPRCWFASALFNDHLIGAVLVTASKHEWQLQHLHVRQVTRRRGVASHLMTLIAAQGQTQSMQLKIALEGLTLAEQIFVQRLGYHLIPGADYFVLDAHVKL